MHRDRNKSVVAGSEEAGMKVTSMGTVLPLVVVKMFWNYIDVTVLHFQTTENHWIEHFKMVNFMLISSQ